jgi:hypothetical protein
VIGDTRIRDLDPCGPPGTGHGWTAVWINIDGYSIGKDSFAQLGYMEVSPGDTVNLVSGRKFVYTPDDTSDGIFRPVPSSWGWGDPIVGDRYEFKIRNDTDATGKNGWSYCLQNQDGDNIERCHWVPAQSNASHGARTFWMFETEGDHSQLGEGVYESGSTVIAEMGYRTTNGTWFTYDGPCNGVGGPSASHYQCVDAGTNDIRGYTFE